MSHIEKLEAKIEELQRKSDDLQEQMDRFCKIDHQEEVEHMYRELLNEGHGKVDYARDLENDDPVAYNEGLSNYADSCSYDDFESYNDLWDEQEEVDSEICDLETEIENYDEDE